MPRRRYSDIARAADLQRQLTAKAAWEATRFANVQQNVGSGTAKSPNVIVQVTAFGADATADDFIVRTNQRNQTALGSFIGNVRVNTTIAANAQRNRNFTPAKVKAFAATGTSTVQTSEITGNRYLKQNGESYQSPFGSTTATEREFEAQNIVRNAILGANPTWRIGFTPERMYGY